MAKDKAKKQNKNEDSSTSQGASTSNQNEKESGIWQDSRFQHLIADPRFKNLPKAQRKVKIDKRFQSMFTDNKFKVKYTVDKYGRRVNQSNAEDLKKYYELDSNDENENDDKVDDNSERGEDKIENEAGSDVDEDEDIEEEQRKEEKAISREANDEGNEDHNDLLGSDGEDISKPLRKRLFDPQIDYARGEGRLITDSSSDDESTDDGEADPNTYVKHTWGELDAEAERTDESSNRLAVCNMDWDRIRAIDLLVLFSSFIPLGGTILNVKIYMSEYGKERLEAEERHGPQELIGFGKEVSNQDDDCKSKDFDNDSSDQDEAKEQDSDAEEGDEYHMEKLRQYQLNRLKYYYAVVECDSVLTADKLYAECDGLEYESSATRIDLRFIPDDTTFDEKPTDECSELPDRNTYQPRLFTNTALQQAKVDLTWDETAVERHELTERLLTGKLEEVNDKDLRKIVAYSSEEEEEEESDSDSESKVKTKQNNSLKSSDETVKPAKSKKSKKDDYINKYKSILAEINEKEEEEKKRKFEIEYTWKINPEDDLDNDNKDNLIEEKPNSELTPIEKVLQKRSEKNKQRKLERKKKKLLAQGLDPDAAEDDTDNESIPDGIDLNDPYFAEEFANGDFIDPKAKKQEQKKKKQHAETVEKEEAERQARELELLLDDDDEEQQGKQHFSLDKILKSEKETKSKRKRRKLLKKSKTEIAAKTKEVEDNFKLNLDDDRFKAVYSSPIFNIDPTHSHFKKTKGMDQLIHEKLKRRHGIGFNGSSDKIVSNENKIEPESKKPKKILEQTLLVNSLKRKLQAKQEK